MLYVVFGAIILLFGGISFFHVCDNWTSGRWKDNDHRDLAKLCKWYYFWLGVLLAAYFILFLFFSFKRWDFDHEYVWLRLYRMIYTIVTFTGYIGFFVIAKLCYY